MPTGSISSELEEDSLLILKEAISLDISLIHLAENSTTPIIFPDPALGVVTFIDFIEIGVENCFGSDGSELDQEDPS